MEPSRMTMFRVSFVIMLDVVNCLASYQTYDRRLLAGYPSSGDPTFTVDVPATPGSYGRQSVSHGVHRPNSYIQSHVGSSGSYGSSSKNHDTSAYGVPSTKYGSSTYGSPSESYGSATYGGSSEKYGGSTFENPSRSYRSLIYRGSSGQYKSSSSKYAGLPVNYGRLTHGGSSAYYEENHGHHHATYGKRAATYRPSQYQTVTAYATPGGYQQYSTEPHTYQEPYPGVTAYSVEKADHEVGYNHHNTPRVHHTIGSHGNQAYPAPEEVYTSTEYDPCTSLPEGDYGLQDEFRSLFPGVDAQCNFIKCANNKAYVNSCSIGTKNTVEGGPHHDYGFCASVDYDHYCGHYPSGDEYKK